MITAFLNNFFSAAEVEKFISVFKSEFLIATWETIYVTLLSTLFAVIIGLPLGILLVAGEKAVFAPSPRGFYG